MGGGQSKQHSSEPSPNVLATIGCAGSGKSTFCHQMCYPVDASEEHRRKKCPAIFMNVVNTTKAICRHIPDDDLEGLGAEMDEFEKYAECDPSELSTDQQEWGLAIKAAKGILSTEIFQKAIPVYKEANVDRDAINLCSALIYFTNDENYARLHKLGYTPTLKDIAHSREVTIHGEEMAFKHEHNGNSLEVIMKDLGGQLMQRESWAQAIGSSSAILFVISLDYSDKSNYTSLEASLKLATSVMSSEDVFDLPFIMIFNKIDIFNKLIKTEPLEGIPGVTWEANCDDAKAGEWLKKIQQYFLKEVEKAIFQRRRSQSKANLKEAQEEKLHDTSKSQIQMYQTCALDRDVVHNVMQAVMKAILQMSVSQSFA